MSENKETYSYLDRRLEKNSHVLKEAQEEKIEIEKFYLNHPILFSLFDRLYFFQLYLLFIECSGFALDIAIFNIEKNLSWKSYEIITDPMLILLDMILLFFILSIVNFKIIYEKQK